MAYTIYDVITPELLKNTLLVGVSLVDPGTGLPFPDEMFTEAIKQGISVVESELGIKLADYRVKDERHDAFAQNRRSWWGSQLDLRPLKSVTKLSISYGNYPETSIPLDWVNITSEVGASVHLIPTASVIGTFNFSNTIPLLIDPISNFSYHERVPAYFKYDYRAGFNFLEGQITIPAGQTQSTEIELSEKFIDTPSFKFEIIDNGGNANITSAKEFDLSNNSFFVNIPESGVTDVIISYKLHTLPNAIVKAILYVAGILPLDTAGDLLAGAGIGQFSLSVDGLSQNVATTASATSAGYGARILSYQKQLASTISSLRNKYSMPKVAVF